MKIITNRVRAFIKYRDSDCEIDFDEGTLTIFFDTSVTFSDLREWIELLEDAQKKPAKKKPDKGKASWMGQWVSRQRAADFYGVTVSCIGLWGKQGRIKRRPTDKIHGPTGATIYLYEIAGVNVPPKGTYEVQP